MSDRAEVISGETSKKPGLRGRQKARRRQRILEVAGALINENGFDATTMAGIAEAADISPPTVFNYFGSKENVLIALLLEATERERDLHETRVRPTGRPFETVLGELLCEFSENTMRIAGKRVWRYAESVNIRRPQTEFQRLFTSSDVALLKLLERFLGDYDLELSADAAPDAALIAILFFDRWTARYFDFIKDDAMPIARHLEDLRNDTAQMVELLFSPAFRAQSPLKKTESPS